MWRFQGILEILHNDLRNNVDERDELVHSWVDELQNFIHKEIVLHFRFYQFVKPRVLETYVEYFFLLLNL